MHGLLNLHKPSGPTSHDCVARVRRSLGTRRVGHAGTLDPLASGVLVLGVGHGTRLLEYLRDLPKVYRAGLRLGLATDTQDITGAALAQADAAGVTREALEGALAACVGEGLQVPPMVSAVKVGGRRLYELARKGETVEREPRPIRVHALELLAFRSGREAEAEFRVSCSAGTYVRTLCHDVGARLGVGGTLTSLVREAVGPFTLADAVPLDSVSSASLLPLEQAIPHLPSLAVGAEDGRRLAHGQFIAAPDSVPDGPVAVYDQHGGLVAIATVRGHGAGRLASPEKVFLNADAADSGS